MNILQRSLIYYWRTHIAIIVGVATAVTVLAGALLVGDSVRASLRDLFLRRLGSTDHVISAQIFFRDRLAEDLRAHDRFNGTFQKACPLIVLEGWVTHEGSGRRASGVAVYGVDERFWSFHSQAEAAPQPGERDVLVTESLAQELGSAAGDTVLLRVEKPTDVPAGSLHGLKVDAGRTIRLTAREWPTGLMEFSLYPRQDAVRAVFVPLERLQRDLEQDGRVNTVLLSETRSVSEGAQQAEQLLKETFTLEDLGIKLRWLEGAGALSVESEAVLLSDTLSLAAGRAASALDMETSSILTYLANVMRTGQREIPYSLVSGLDPKTLEATCGDDDRGSIEAPIVLNDWAARDLGIQPGDPLTVEYYVWQDEGRLTTRTAEFQVVGIVALEGAAADPDFAPHYPGITESEDVGDWEPPFPIDLSKIRDVDEAYWDRYRTTPKAFIPLTKGQELWQNRYGKLTSIRVRPGDDTAPASVIQTYEAHLRDELDPIRAGFSIYPVRAQGLSASRGATDFGEYFVYFSFFLVVSALLLTGLFFKLGVEQRLQEVGILHAMGFTPARIQSLFLAEGTVLAAVGAIIGLIGALAYAGLIMVGLRTWWIDAVGTRLLTLHVSPLTLALGGAGGILAASVGIAWTMRGLRPLTPRALLMGSTITTGTRGRAVSLIGIGSAVTALILLIGSMAGWLSQVAGFFGAGSLLLAAFLCHLWIRLSGTNKKLLAGTGHRAISKLGFRNATFRPGRSLLSVALIAFASFIIVAVDAFRRDDESQALDWHSGNGGYPLSAESMLPLHWDPNTSEGRQELDLDDSTLEQVRFTSFRLRPGDDTSCLNLYRPSNPRIIAPPADFLETSRFAFRSSVAETDEEEDNPWLLLKREESDGAIPVVGDANSMTYVLHLELGEEFLLPRSGDEPLRLRLVATLADSIFQSELLMSEENFLRLFPGQSGFRFFLLESAPGQSETVTELLEQRLSDSGFDVTTTAERLAGFHRVENTYLSTFQTLGGLGLVLGTLGLAAVMLRNIFERRRELALLRAVGYGTGHFSVMVLAENSLLLFWGLLIGSVCALIAIAPAIVSHGGSFSLFSLSLLLLAVLASGLTASVLAVVASTRTALLPALRAE